jgi:hypothetical protein
MAAYSSGDSPQHWQKRRSRDENQYFVIGLPESVMNNGSTGVASGYHCRSRNMEERTKCSVSLSNDTWHTFTLPISLEMLYQHGESVSVHK